MLAAAAFVTLLGPPASALAGASGSLDPSFGSGGTAFYPAGFKGEPQSVTIHALGFAPAGEITLGGTATPEHGGEYRIFAARVHEDGSLDSAYGSGGTVATDYPPGAEVPGYPAEVGGNGGLVEADGAMVLGSDTDKYRLDPAGAFDGSFQNSRTPLGVRAAAALPGGEVLLGGSKEEPKPEAGQFEPPAVQLLHPEGVPDQRWGAEGVEVIPTRPGYVPTTAGVESLLTLPDGEVLAAGVSSKQGSAGPVGDVAWIAELTQEGKIDTSFGSGGFAYLPAKPPVRLAREPNGAILLGGPAPSSEEAWQATVWALLPDGALDTAFGSGGTSTLPILEAGDRSVLKALQVDGAGNVYAGVNQESFNVPYARGGYVARLTSAGGLDGSFGSGGTATLGEGGDIDDFALDPAGRLLIVYFLPANTILPRSTVGVLRLERMLTSGPGAVTPTGHGPAPGGAKPGAAPKLLAASLRCALVRHGRDRGRRRCVLVVHRVRGRWRTIEVRIASGGRRPPLVRARRLRTPLTLVFFPPRHERPLRIDVVLRSGRHRAVALYTVR